MQRSAKFGLGIEDQNAWPYEVTNLDGLELGLVISGLGEVLKEVCFMHGLVQVIL